jgi:hypothetical protein
MRILREGDMKLSRLRYKYFMICQGVDDFCHLMGLSICPR